MMDRPIFNLRDISGTFSISAGLIQYDYCVAERLSNPVAPRKTNFIVNFTFLGAVGSIPTQKQEYDQTATLT